MCRCDGGITFLRHVKTGVVLFCYQLPEEKFQKVSILVSQLCFFTRQCRGWCNYTKHLPKNIVKRSVVHKKEHGMSDMLQTLFYQMLKKKNFFCPSYKKNGSFFAKFSTGTN